MNKNAARLNLQSTLFDSPHGLMNYNSKSNAYDIAKLSAICLEDPRFTTITNTKVYKVAKRAGNRRAYCWEQTHKMLGQTGVIPIKTGITNAAGPCLSTAIELQKGCPLVVVILQCKDMDCRWMETYKLAKWATHRILKIRHF